MGYIDTLGDLWMLVITSSLAAALYGLFHLLGKKSSLLQGRNL
jgi:hypothetical protein